MWEIEKLGFQYYRNWGRRG